MGFAMTGRVIAIFCWLITIVCAGCGAYDLYQSMHAANLPQQEAFIIFAIGEAVVPYVLTRAIEGFFMAPSITMSVHDLKSPAQRRREEAGEAPNRVSPPATA